MSLKQSNAWKSMWWICNSSRVTTIISKIFMAPHLWCSQIDAFKVVPIFWLQLCFFCIFAVLAIFRVNHNRLQYDNLVIYCRVFKATKKKTDQNFNLCNSMKMCSFVVYTDLYDLVDWCRLIDIYYRCRYSYHRNWFVLKHVLV